MTRDDDELRDLAASGSLDALTPDERARLDAALAADADLAREASAFDETAAQLGLAVDPVEPAPSSRAALMALIATTPQVGADALPERTAPDDADVVVVSGANGSPDASAEPDGSERATATPAETRARSRWGARLGVILGAAAAAIALFIGGIAVGGGFSGGTPTDATATALAQINAAPDAQRRTQTLDDGRTATLVWSDDVEQGALLVEALPALDADETYEAWVMTDAGAQPAGTFSGSTNAVTVHVISGGMPSGATIGVTVEPSGGSKTPTGDPIIALPTT